jgi:hypothetical protein
VRWAYVRARACSPVFFGYYTSGTHVLPGAAFRKAVEAAQSGRVPLGVLGRPIVRSQGDPYVTATTGSPPGGGTMLGNLAGEPLGRAIEETSSRRAPGRWSSEVEVRSVRGLWV